MSYGNSLWQTRITNAHKYFDAWHSKFKCNQLEDYYEGIQWKFKRDLSTVNYNPYTINLVYSTIKIKLASLLFQKPKFILAPRPGNSQWDLDFAVQSSALKQDTLNTIIGNPAINFTTHLKLAALDSFFRFGLIEVGYAADWRNPQKEPPLLKSWDDPDTPTTKDKVLSDNDVPINERMFVKRIPPRRFRCALNESSSLDDHEWCGYYEFIYTNELRKTKGIKWPLEAGSGLMAADYSGGIIGDSSSQSDNPEFLRLLSSGAISKVWNIFDNVAHKRCLYLDGCWDDVLWEGDNERLPLIDLRWDLRLEGFYPIPPVFQWLSPQDEINEAREQTRSYRRRFTRKFQAVKGTVDEEEKEKFASGPDGVIVEVKQPNAISAIDNPEQGHTTENALLLAKDDFNIISGTSAEARGQNADRQTATQSRIMDSRAQIRESAEQMDFSNAVCLVGREILAQAQEKLSEGLWVKYTHNPSEQVLTDMQVNGPIFKYIKAQDLSDGYDFDIEIDIQNATPAAMQAQQQAFMTFVAMVHNYPELAMSPTLIREAAYRSGYRNEQVIHQMQQTALLAMAAKAAQAAAQKGQTLSQASAATGNNAAQTQIAQQASPDMEAVDNQISQQLQ